MILQRFNSARVFGALLALAACGSTTVAADAANAALNQPDAESPVLLNVFEVSSSSDRGLLSTNALSATKSSTPIKEIPGNIYVLNQEFIQDQIPYDLNDILRFAPGVSIDNDYRNETYQIRGFSGGFPLADGFTISRSFPTEQSAVERVEVLQGPAGILFGNMAGVGGVVNRIMKKPSFRPASSLSFSLRSNDENARAVYDTTGPVGDSRRLAYRAIVAFEHDEGPVDFRKLDRQYFRPSLLWQISAQTKITFEPEVALQRTVIGYDYDYFDRSGNGRLIRVPRASNPAENYWHTNSAKYSMMTIFTHAFSRDWTLRAAAFTTANFLHDDDPRVNSAINADNTTISRGSADSAHPQGYLQQQERYVGNYYFQADLAGKVALGAATMKPIVGVEWKLDPNQTNIRRTATGLGGIVNAPFNLFAPNYGQYGYPAAIQTIDQQQGLTDARSGYVNDQLNLFHDRLSLVAGIRLIKSWTSSRARSRQLAEDAAADKAGRTPVDTITHGNSNWDHVKRYGVVYQLTSALGLYASYSESYEARTFTNNLGEIQPPGLGKQKEAGVKSSLFDGRVTATVSVYQLKQVNNILNYATGTFGPRGETSDAIGQVESKGWDVSGVITVTDALQIIPGYSHARATTLVGGLLTNAGASTSNLEISKYPANIAKAYGRYSFNSGALTGLAIDAGVAYTSRVDEGLLSAIAPFAKASADSIVPSSTIFNVGAIYAITPRLRLSVKVDNVTNRHYYSPAASSNLRALVGLPRTFSVNVTYKY